MGELPFREADSLQSEIAASVTGDYVRNTQILINMARCVPTIKDSLKLFTHLHHRAIGRLVMLHKEVNLLAGYTGRCATVHPQKQTIHASKQSTLNWATECGTYWRFWKRYRTRTPFARGFSTCLRVI